MARVFVVQNQMERDPHSGGLREKFDFSSAKKFGELVELLSPGCAPANNDEVVAELKEKLRDFCDDDHLLLVGNPVLIGLAYAIAADANEGRVRALQWHGRKRQYNSIAAKDIFDIVQD